MDVQATGLSWRKEWIVKDKLGDEYTFEQELCLLVKLLKTRFQIRNIENNI